ncbi:hypothetical protein OF83DRAFT_1049772 [Amylostereum chailletii]|nr:hypothetical protein OF83DRAFT_1049772 [Amylostereum chailletii]
MRYISSQLFPSLKPLKPKSFTRPFSFNAEAVDQWISRKKQSVLTETLNTDRISDLYITLPTRDGTRKSYEPPKDGTPLPYGHHLPFFHARVPEPELRSDATDGDFCPPPPFDRRMWAGGKIEWKRPLLVGDKATSVSTVVPSSVEKKGFNRGAPMLFVTQDIEVTTEGRDDVAIREQRSHVYVSTTVGERKVRKVENLPSPDFSFTYIPTPVTLFRFSALMFNAHHIHLDRDYAQNVEGYTERLVHGPLTALMLLDSFTFHNPVVQIKTFEYRAVNPILVNESSTIHGAWTSSREVQLWAVNPDGVVGMWGKVLL